MSFESIVGQKRPKSVLTGALQRGTLASSYLFSGPGGVGKLALAVELAKAFICQEEESRPCDRCSTCRRIGKLSYPDVSLHFPVPSKVKPEEILDAIQELAADLYHLPRFRKSVAISIGTIRRIQVEASYKPYEGKRRVFILAEADKMTEQAANALLKILEEPPPNTLFILTTAQPSRLPATVLSRCQRIRFAKLSQAELGRSLQKDSHVEPARSHLISRLAQGNLDRARELLHEDVEKRRTEALKILTTVLSGDMLSMIKLAEVLGRSRDPSIHLQNLEALRIWYRDLLLVLEGKEDLLINQDLKSRLVKMASHYDWKGVHRALSLIQEVQRALAANVNPELVWQVLLFRLRRQRRV